MNTQQQKKIYKEILKKISILELSELIKAFETKFDVKASLINMSDKKDKL